MASVEKPKNAHAMIEPFQRMYKARKKAGHAASGRRCAGLVQERGARLPDEGQSGAAGSDVGRGEEIVEVRGV